MRSNPIQVNSAQDGGKDGPESANADHRGTEARDRNSGSQETYLTVEELRHSFREASRKPRTLEDWALVYVPRLLDRLAEAPADSDHPTCLGKWLLFTSPGAAPVLYTVKSEDDLIKYGQGDSGYLWYGPIPDAVADEADGDRFEPKEAPGPADANDKGVAE